MLIYLNKEKNIMVPIWKPQSDLVYENWIDRIIADSANDMKELSDWELQFIHSIQNRLRMKQSMTELIANKLEEIYVKYSSM